MKLIQNSIRCQLQLTIIVLYLSTVYGCNFASSYVPVDKSQLRGSGKIFFIPITDFPSSELQPLADYYRSKYGLEIEVKPNLRVTSTQYDSNRQQFIAEGLAALMTRTYAASDEAGKAVLIGVIGDDMYIKKMNWRYAFSYRRDEDRVAVVSSARMNYGFLSLWQANKETQQGRLRKMITKNIGVLYYNLPLSDNPKSVMYRKVGGPQELDRMAEDF
jgi:predicted Zn-dependent protease